MESIMRYNDWQNDPFSEKCPSWSIAARFDIPSNECKHAITLKNYGAIDAKITSVKLAKKLAAKIISGPTAQNQHPFSWKNNEQEELVPESIPSNWNFKWLLISKD